MSGSADSLTVAVRAKPGSRAQRVGGAWGDPPQLVVAVRARAVDGAANAAVAGALAEAFGVPRSAVRIVRGQRARSKLVAIDGDRARLHDALRRLLQSC